MIDCISIDVAKLLYDVGYREQTEYLWYSQNKEKIGDYWTLSGWKLIRRTKGDISDFAIKYGYKKYLPAPTATQLQDAIPGNFDGQRAIFNKGLLGNMYYATIVNIHNESADLEISAKTFPDVCGLVVVHLLETANKSSK